MQMMYVLSFLACLAGKPDGHCQNVEIAWGGTPHQCMLFGQMEMARWVRDNPGYVTPRGYKCLPGREI